MAPEEASPLGPEVEAQYANNIMHLYTRHTKSMYRRQRARVRESRAAANFAPPNLERLNETYTRPRQRYFAPDFQPENDELCPTCTRISLLELFRSGLEHETRDGIQIRTNIPMGYSDEIYARATCPLCRLLVEIGDTNMLGGDRDVEFWSIITLKGHEVISNVVEPLYEIGVNNSNSDLETSPPVAYYLALVRTVKAPPGYGFEYRTIFKDMIYIGLLAADELPPSGSFTLRDTADAAEMMKRFREWFARCREHKACRAREALGSSRPDGFRLLDINSLRVADGRGHAPYIALSYPWSQVDAFEIKRTVCYVVETLPKVLQDIVSVVKGLELGINHLWIDRLCVDQEDTVQKRVNIAAMGEIYGAAFATIILAVPSQGAPEQGLSGLSLVRRPYQRVEKVGDLKLATTLPSLEMAIVTSKWNSRAWTFQEGLLSSRCILFGPEQTYFECAEMACYESIKEPDLAVSEQDHLIPYKSRLRNPFLSTYEFDSLYWRLVRDYTGRDMSLPSDSLNAFSAFTREFQNAGETLTWGLPISASALNLLWEHEPWDFRNIYRRRDFPSWSWAGWNGTTAMNFPLDAGSDASYICTVREEPPDGRILSCHVRTAHVGISGSFSIYSAVGAAQSSFIVDCGVNVVPEWLAQGAVMVEICRVKDTVHGILVQQSGECYERVGSGFLKLSDFEAAQADWQDLRLT